MSKKIIIDVKNEQIIRELVKDSRVSDVVIAQKTNIPVATVQKRRQSLEDKRIISTMTYVNHYVDGPQKTGGKALVILHLAKGISKVTFLHAFGNMERDKSEWFSRHVSSSSYGEQDGQVVWTLVVESRIQQDIVEILNADVYPMLKQYLGANALDSWKHIPLVGHLRLLHNYSFPVYEPKPNVPRVQSNTVFIR